VNVGAFAQFQALVTVEGDSSTSSGTSMTQPVAEWADVSNWADGVVTLQTYSVTTAGSDTVSFELRTATEESNPQTTANGGLATTMWTVGTMSSGSIDKKAIYLHPDNTKPMERFVFWALDINGTAGAWRVTFKVTGILKTPA